MSIMASCCITLLHGEPQRCLGFRRDICTVSIPWDNGAEHRAAWRLPKGGGSSWPIRAGLQLHLRFQTSNVTSDTASMAGVPQKTLSWLYDVLKRVSHLVPTLKCGSG